jgi:hypothetical protein
MDSSKIADGFRFGNWLYGSSAIPNHTREMKLTWRKE